MTTATGIAAPRKLNEVLLFCGIAAGIVWVGTDIAAGMLYSGYSFLSQATSELFAIGAPTSSLVVTLFTLFDLLLIAFAVGVWKSSNRSTVAPEGRRKDNRALKVAAAMLAGTAACGLILWPFFPMHMRGNQATFTDTMHLTITAISVPLGLLALGFGAAAMGRPFRYFSIAAIVGLVVPGVLGLSYAPQVAANQPTPWLGLYERIAQYVNSLWILVFAIVLLQQEKALAQLPAATESTR